MIYTSISNDCTFSHFNNNNDNNDNNDFNDNFYVPNLGRKPLVGTYSQNQKTAYSSAQNTSASQSQTMTL